jgi:hypothetical protein
MSFSFSAAWPASCSGLRSWWLVSHYLNSMSTERPSSRTVSNTLVVQSVKSRARVASSVRELRSAVADAGTGIVHLQTALERVHRDYSALTASRTSHFKDLARNGWGPGLRAILAPSLHLRPGPRFV